MAKALILTLSGAGGSIANTDNVAVAGFMLTLSSEVFAQFPVGVAGTFSNLAVLASSTGGSTSATFFTRVSTANGNETVNLVAGSIVEDTVNTDSVSVGNYFNYEQAVTSVLFWSRTVFSASTNHATLFDATNNLTLNSSTIDIFVSPMGAQGGSSATEANSQRLLRSPGTLNRFHTYVQGLLATTVFAVRINSSDGNQTITVSSATGLFEDTTNTDAVVSGDKLCNRMNTNSTGNVTVRRTGITFSTTATSNDIGGGTGPGGTTRTASTTVHYVGLAGFTSLSAAITTESQVAVSHGFAGTISKMRFYVSANTYDANATWKSRKNSADGSQSVTISTGATGWMEDTSNSDTFTASDLINYSVDGGGSTTTTATFTGWVATESETTVTVNFAIPLYYPAQIAPKMDMVAYDA